MYPKVQNNWKIDYLSKQDLNSKNVITDLKSTFNLKSTTRDSLVWYLSKFLSTLNGKNLSFDDEECLINSGVKLITILNNLTLESNEIQSINKNTKFNKSNEDEKIIVVLSINQFLKTELISHFSMVNEFFFNQNAKNNYINKDNLIISNNNLIQSLMSLPIAFIEKLDDKKQNEYFYLNNDRSINNGFYFNYDDNDDEIKIIQKRIDCYSKILYIFELNDVSKFLKSGLNNTIQSDFLCCNGLLWKVWIRNSIANNNIGEEIRLIDFGITCCNYDDNKSLIDIKSKLIIFTNFANRSNKETNYSIQHISAKQCKMVWKRFITVKELTRLSNGFIRQNKFNFSIDLEVIKRTKLKKKCLIM